MNEVTFFAAGLDQPKIHVQLNVPFFITRRANIEEFSFEAHQSAINEDPGRSVAAGVGSFHKRGPKWCCSRQTMYSPGYVV